MQVGAGMAVANSTQTGASRGLGICPNLEMHLAPAVYTAFISAAIPVCMFMCIFGFFA